MLQRTALILAAVLTANFLFAQDRPGNALGLFDAWLAQAAAETPAYRADLRAGGDPDAIPPGRGFGRSALLGPFTYRPKTYGELTRSERAAVLADPKFRAFLIAMRRQCDGENGVEPVAPRPANRPDPMQISPTPVEMLHPGPAWWVLPP
jgi:hypothetical protein